MKVRAIEKTYSEVFSDFVSNLQYKDLPREVIKKVKMHFLDSIGVALACPKFDYAIMLNEVLFCLGGKPQSTVIGQKRKLPAPMAAFANGSLVHGIEFDDLHLHSLIPVSSFIVPVTLAVAEERRSRGEEVIAAAVAGYEVVSRMGMAAYQKFYQRGFHSTSILGSFGSAITAGKLMGLNSDKLATAMGIVGSIHGAGLREFLNDGTWTKRLHPGWAAHCGIIAALLAEKGFTAPHRIIEGSFGLFNSYLGPNQFDESTLVRGLGDIWETLRISYKLYPSGYATHIYMDSAFFLKQKYNIKPEEIVDIHVKVSELEEKIVLGKKITKYRPPTTYAARFSLPYCLAVRLTSDQIGMNEFSEEVIKDEAILSLAQKVSWSVDPNIHLPELCGYVAVKTKDNKVYENTERFLRGSPDKPAEDMEIENKFRLNSKQICSSAKQEKIIHAVLGIDQMEDIFPLMRLVGF